MNQRFQALQKLGEQFEVAGQEASQEATAVERRGILARISRALQSARPQALVLGGTTLVAVIVALVVVLGGNGTAPSLTQAPAGEEASLIATYAVLGEPQSTVARATANSGPAAALNREIFDYPILSTPQKTGTSAAGAGAARFLSGTTGLNMRETMGSLHFHLRTVGWAPYRNIPRLTREVTVDHVRVWFFVVYHPVTHDLPRAIVTGNYPKGAAPYTTKSYLTRLRRQVNSTAGYQLWVRVGVNGVPRPIAPARVLAQRAAGPLILGRPDTARSASLAGYLSTASATLPGPDGKIVAVLPRGVARISWMWPRDFYSSTLSFLPRLTESAPVSDNVAVLDGPARYVSGPQFPPETVVYYRAGGRVLASYTNPGASTLESEHTFEDRTTPGPQTVLSREAERNPSTPNRTLILPAVTRLTPFRIRGKHKTFYELSPHPLIAFKLLLNDRNYYAHVSGGPRPSCDNNEPSQVVNRIESRRNAFRGHRFDSDVRGSVMPNLPFDVSCRGTYRVAVSVLNADGKPFKPFATVTLRVR